VAVNSHQSGLVAVNSHQSGLVAVNSHQSGLIASNNSVQSGLSATNSYYGGGGGGGNHMTDIRGSKDSDLDSQQEDVFTQQRRYDRKGASHKSAKSTRKGGGSKTRITLHTGNNSRQSMKATKSFESGDGGEREETGGSRPKSVRNSKALTSNGSGVRLTRAKSYKKAYKPRVGGVHNASMTWSQAYDYGSGAYYYVNNVTGEVSWTLPEGAMLIDANNNNNNTNNSSAAAAMYDSGMDGIYASGGSGGGGWNNNNNNSPYASGGSGSGGAGGGGLYDSGSSQAAPAAVAVPVMAGGYGNVGIPPSLPPPPGMNPSNRRSIRDPYGLDQIQNAARASYSAGNPIFNSGGSGGGGGTTTARGGWEEVYDGTTDSSYWVNVQTGEYTYTNPYGGSGSR
jgi:hypothetical protein